MGYLLDRLSENSTWRGIIGLATALGITINPDMQAAIVAVGMALIGLINVLRKDKTKQTPNLTTKG